MPVSGGQGYQALDLEQPGLGLIEIGQTRVPVGVGVFQLTLARTEGNSITTF